MKRIALTVAVAAVLAWVLSGTGFCQDDDETERRERKPRWKEMRGREGGRGEKMEKFLEHLKDENPEKFEDLMRLKEENPDLFREKLREHVGEFIKNKQRKGRERMDPETRERMKERGELEKQSMRLAEQYRGAETDEEKQTIAEDMKAVLVRAFDMKLLNQQKNVERLEKRLKELKDLLNKRKESRDDVIQKRFDELTGKAEHLKW